MGNKKILIIKTIIAVLSIELTLGMSLIIMFYYNYDTYATAKSGVSDKIDIPLKKLDFSTSKIESSEDKKDYNQSYYQGVLGKISENKVTKERNGTISKIKIIELNLNDEEIKRAVLLDILIDSNLLDGYTYDYFKKVHYDNLEIELTNFLKFHVLLGTIRKEEIDSYQDKWLKSYKDFTLKSMVLIKQDRYSLLTTKLQTLEKKYTNTLAVKKLNIPESSVLLSDNFKYVLDKLKNNKEYINPISLASENIGIDKNLLLASIGVEQIRFMSTKRGYAKNLIKQNKYLTNFSKFSYGLGGIKVKTARQIQANSKIFHEELYNEYLEDDNTREDEEIISVLSDNYSGLIYASSLLKNIQSRWKEDGFDLSNRPGIIITLYNMGNPEHKKPNAHPDLGGSLIDLDGEQLYFGEIGYLFYYYLKYYID